MAPSPDTLARPRRRYAWALAIAAVAIACRWLLDPVFGFRHPFIAQFIATIVAAYAFGTGPGWVVWGVTSVVSTILFVIPSITPDAPLAGIVVGGVASIAAAAANVVFIGALSRSRREAQRQAEAAVAAEERARRRDTYLREFMDHTSALMYVRDLDGRYVLANKRAGEVFPDLARRETGALAEEWLPPEVARRRAAIAARVIETGKSETFEETVPLDGGTQRWVSVKFPIADDTGRTVALGGVSTDVTDLLKARADLERTERVLRNLIEIQEQEKQLLCSEFHDGLIQYAVGAKMMLESVPGDRLPGACAEAIQAAIDSLARGIEDGRRVIHGIRPAELDDLGLVPALNMLVQDLDGAGLAVASSIDPAIGEVPPTFQVTVFRIVQEALSNVRRHSGSERVILEMRREGGEIVVRIEDFGTGGDDWSGTARGFGITGMQERARLAGGECRVDFRPGLGTVVTARLPIPEAPPAPVSAPSHPVPVTHTIPPAPPVTAGRAD